MKKIALVTGASSGIGRETARLLQESGYIVYGGARRLDKMLELERIGVKLLRMDVADDASMVDGTRQITATEGRIDVLVNNAGFGAYGTVEDVPMADARYQLEVNLFGTARLIQLALPHMRKQHYGKIVNVTSIGGKMATPLDGWYHASKFAVEGLSDSLRNEVRPFGIDVIVIEPGGVKTEWSDISVSNLHKVSGGSAYASLIKAAEVMTRSTAKGAEPLVIAQLIKKSIEVKQPRARYAKGYMAGPILFLKRWLSDRMFDRMILSQLKTR